MITLSLAESGLRAYLIDQARDDDSDRLRSYRRVAEETDPQHDPNDRRHNRLKQRLFHISSYEVEHGRPMLSALVVHRADYRPGEGLYELARHLGRLKEGDVELEWWKAEVEEVTRYWTTHSDDPVKDAQFNAIMAELTAIKRMVRTLMHT
jgi:hypothetical protein